MTVLIVPGIGNSGPEHWQSLWQTRDSSFRRIEVDSWDYPNRTSWVESIHKAVVEARDSALLVAHSLGCLAVAHWANQSYHPKVTAALLVAPPDPSQSGFPQEAKGFAPVPLNTFPFKTILVSSSNDPYGTSMYAESCARSWNSKFVNIGAAGHINTASNLGDWPEGFALLKELLPRSTS
jgi:predicted alpha/beta hydrolase family esterase